MKDEALRCWCCVHFLARFDDDVAPNRILGGICIKKRKECIPYDEKCDNFYIKTDLLPKTQTLHSADAYAKRQGISFYDK